MANNNQKTNPSVTLTIEPATAEVGSTASITLTLTTSKGSYSNEGNFSAPSFYANGVGTTSPYRINPVADGSITFKGKASFNGKDYENTKVFTGFRYAFAGATDSNTINSSIIRSVEENQRK